MTNEIPILDRSGLRQFGLTTGAIVAALFGIAFPYLLGMSWPIWPWVVFVVLAVWAMIAPASLKFVYRGWMQFGMILGRITTPIILTLLFLVAILPVALLMRLFRKDPMRRSFDESTSYRVEAKQPSVKNLEKPY
jgi:hypothetical protein